MINEWQVHTHYLKATDYQLIWNQDHKSLEYTSTKENSQWLSPSKYEIITLQWRIQGGGSLGSDEPPLRPGPGVVAENARTGCVRVVH